MIPPLIHVQYRSSFRVVGARATADLISINVQLLGIFNFWRFFKTWYTGSNLHGSEQLYVLQAKSLTFCTLSLLLEVVQLAVYLNQPLLSQIPQGSCLFLTCENNNMHHFNVLAFVQSRPYLHCQAVQMYREHLHGNRTVQYAGLCFMILSQ